MEFYDKHNNADGKFPDYGAIFMSNSGTKRECFNRGLFGLPSSAMRFVEQIKTGMILFLFEHEKRQLHGVFKAASDGAMNIVPSAFSSTRQKFPAQVKSVQIWHCKPLSESVFRDAIRENYFSATKFNFGLSEKQVGRLLKLFSMRKLEQEVLGIPFARMKDLTPESYPMGKAGRSFHHGMHVISVQDDQSVQANISPIQRHKCQGDSLQYHGEGENNGFNARDIVSNTQGRAAERARDATSGYTGDFLAFQDEFRNATREKEPYINVSLRPTISGGYPRSPSDEIRVHSDGVFSRSHRLMNEDLIKDDQRMVFSDDTPGLHRSNVPSGFYRKPLLEHNSLLHDMVRPTSAMIQPTQEGLLDNSCATHEYAGSKRTLLYDPDYPDLNFSQASPVRVNCGSNSMPESASLPNICGRNSFSNQTYPTPTKVNDMNNHDVGYGFLNHVPYDSYRDCMPSNVVQSADLFIEKSAAYETHNGPFSLNPSLALGPPPDIGNSDEVHDPHSYLFPSCKSYVGNDIHPMALRENLGHEMKLRKNNEFFTCDVPWANEGPSQAQYDDLLVHEYDTGYHVKSQNTISSHVKKKNSVFSRLSFIQDINKQEIGDHALDVRHHFNTSVDEVMEMVSQSHNQWMQRRKPKPLIKRSKPESLRDKTQTISSRINGGDFFENTFDDARRNKTDSLRSKTQTINPSIKTACVRNSLNGISMDLNAASEENSGKTPEVVDFKRRSKVSKLDDELKTGSAASDDSTSKTPEESCFVDFKRRSEARKHEDVSKIGGFKESEKSEKVVLVQPKRRKLIRPNFSRSPTSDVKGINLGMPQNVRVPLSHESSDSSYVEDSGTGLIQAKENLTIDAEVKNFIGQTHSGDKISRSHAGGVVNSGVKARDGPLTALNDGAHCLDIISNPNASSVSCTDKSCEIQNSLHMIDSNKSVSLDMGLLHSMSQEHQADMINCTDRFVNTEEVSKDGSSSSTVQVKDGSNCLLKSDNENAPNGTSFHINGGLPAMDGIKSVSQLKEPLHSTCEEDHVGDIACAGRGIVTEEERPKDGGYNFTIEVKNRSECSLNSGNNKAPTEASSQLKEASHAMDCTKSASLDTERLHSVCQEHRAEKIFCAGNRRGVDTEKEVPEDSGPTFTIEVQNRPECMQKSGNGSTPIEASSHVKEAPYVMDGTKSVSSDTEALHSICQEQQVDKIIWAGSSGGIGTEKEMSKDVGSSFAVEVQNISECMQKSCNERAPTKASSHVKEALHVDDGTKTLTLDAEALHSIRQEAHADKVASAHEDIDTENDVSKDGVSSFAVEAKVGSNCLQNSCNEDVPVATSFQTKEACD